MKTATILPQAFIGEIKNDDYHMALAHLLDAPGYGVYSSFYEMVGKDPEKFLIMDTGLIEGDARPVEELIEKARKYNADEMVLNDVFMDSSATLQESYKALKKIEESGLNIRKMAVPQGNCLEDWVMCAREMLKWPIDTIGIPKVLVKLEGSFGRLKALIEIQEELATSGVEVHLLGCWESPLELKVIEGAIRDKTIMPVRGVDSAIAFVYASGGIKISEGPRPDGPVNFAAQHVDMDILRYNIELWKHEAKTLPSKEEAANNKLHRLY